MMKAFLLFTLLSVAVAAGTAAVPDRRNIENRAEISSSQHRSASPGADFERITHLPGFHGNLASEQTSGYITVDASRGRRLFFWLVESEGDPANDPVILWLTGGPGMLHV